MDVSEARDHLEMVEKIIAASSTKLEAGGEFFVIWGVAGAAFDGINYLVGSGRLAPGYQWCYFVILGLAVALTMLRSRAYRKTASRMSLLQREYLNMLWLTIAMAFLMSLLGGHLLGNLGIMATWNVVEAIVLFYIGMHGNRRATIGAIVLLISIALANFIPEYDKLWLAAGVLFGYGGFGVADLLARE